MGNRIYIPISTRCPSIFSEITTKNVRGRFTAIPALTVGWGVSFMYVVGSFVSWRTLALIATIPGLLQLLPLFFIPESPRWLAKVGRDKEIEDVLLCLRGNKADIFNEAAEIKDFVESLKSFSKEGMLEIFQKKYVGQLLTVAGMIILMNLGGVNAFAFYSGVIFVSAGNTIGLNNLHKNLKKIMVGLITLAATQTIVGIVGILLIDKLGRRPLLLVSTAVLCFSSFLTGLSFFLKEFNLWDQGGPVLALIGLLMYTGSSIVGAGIPSLLLSELFPINVKGSAGSICNFMGSFTGWVVAYYFNFLREWSSTGTFFIFSAFCCANFILSATMVPETKGRTLEEIQASVNAKLFSVIAFSQLQHAIVKRVMEQQRTEATESLLVRQGNDNLVHNEENGGVGDGGSVAVSDVTTILGLSTFVAACIAFGSGCAVGYSSPTESSIMEDLGLSVAEFSVFGSILSVGALLGSAVSGKITDLLGRKLTMWILNSFYIGGWLAIAFTKTPWLLDLGRLSLGFTIGTFTYLMPIYLSEITTKNVRGRFSVIPSLTVGWGVSFMYVVGSFVSWRTLALIATIPGLLQLLPLFFIPESPRWLAKVGRDKELEDVLLCLRGNKADIFNEAAEIKDYVESLKSSSKEGILEIFQKKYFRPLLTVVGMIILTNLGGANAFAFYSGVIFVSAGLSSMVGLITLAVTQTIVGVLGIILIDKLGRRPLQLVSTAGLCFSCFLTGLSFLLKMYTGSYIVGSGIPWLLLSELFPINVKGSAGSICNFMGSCTGLVVAYYFNFLTEWSSTGTYFIFSACCAANFILSATMVPETKGRALEEIQASITHSLD
ncbi:sugar transporter ERD6-like 15 isoform X1 [Gossypium australe]|uniref:Sugar transporter ERD6-like 15 isoform X1 n=1 Tax=Gossypium australe TaxID=47621 RepID=A0A5B6VTY8_9ROSI|nr:sugar transporter ERD6-like 15 isoform X1 [Gossypium australe]